MEKLKVWCGAQFAERKVEPNSGLGKAISYLFNHWEKLTLFLREPGAPLDNKSGRAGIEEIDPASQELAVLQEPEWSADGRPVRELIHTCELNHVNPFDYLTELQRHAGELKQTPSETGCPGTTARRWRGPALSWMWHRVC